MFYNRRPYDIVNKVFLVYAPFLFTCSVPCFSTVQLYAEQYGWGWNVKGPTWHFSTWPPQEVQYPPRVVSYLPLQYWNFPLLKMLEAMVEKATLNYKPPSCKAASLTPSGNFATLGSWRPLRSPPPQGVMTRDGIIQCEDPNRLHFPSSILRYVPPSRLAWRPC